MKRKTKSQLARARKITRLIEQSDMAALQQLIERGWDISEPLVNDPPLVVAVSDGRIQVARFLIKCGAKVDQRSHTGYTSLMYTCGVNDLAMCRMLLEAGANANARTSKKNGSEPKGMTPLMIGIRHENHAMCDYLLDVAGCDDECHCGWLALNFALEMRNAKLTRKLLDHGSRVCEDALRIPVFDGDRDLVAELIAKGADINAMAKKTCRSMDSIMVEDKTMLAIAVSNGHVEVAETLIKHGADLELKSKGASPLAWAVSSNHRQCVELLLESGADLNTKCDGRSLTEMMSEFDSMMEKLPDTVTALDDNGRSADREAIRTLLLNQAEQGQRAPE